MAARYSEEFKQQAVQKLLNRGQGVTIEDITTPLGVAMSTMYRWTINFQRTTSNGHNNKTMTKPTNEKRPGDWTKKQRFNAIVACHDLSIEQISVYCRSHGICASY
jgi:transposase-like protein